jgi:hypothetical protein
MLSAFLDIETKEMLFYYVDDEDQGQMEDRNLEALDQVLRGRINQGLTR